MASNVRRVSSTVRSAVRRRLDSAFHTDEEYRALNQQIAELRAVAKQLRKQLAAGSPKTAPRPAKAKQAAPRPAEPRPAEPRPAEPRPAEPRPERPTPVKPEPMLLTEEQPAPDLGYVFIVAYGRSGSTLLQGILNSIPGYNIYGENRGALHDLFRYHAALDSQRISKTRSRALSPQSSWYGIDRYENERAIAAMRSLVVHTLLRPAAETRVVGFKEIRWFYADWKEYLEFLRTLFPGARFILNTRSHEAVAQSKWWAEAKNPMAQLKRYEAAMDEMTDILGESSYRVHYDDYVNNHAALGGLFSWLGETLDIKKVEDVMAVKHSY